VFKIRKKRGILSDESGATLVYVSLMLGLFLGVVGLTADFSRFYISDTQAQQAADAAAIAGASQLDGLGGSITRATNAAQATPLVNNTQNFATEGNAAANVQIASIRFLDSLPASDDTPITGGVTTSDFDAEFIEVTTEVLTHNNLFLNAIGAAKTKTLTATAVAGQEAAICRVTPLMICNPAEQSGSGSDFDVTQWVGKQILAHDKGGNNSSWAPGNFGFLNVPGVGNGAKALGETLASVDGADTCFSTRVDTMTGNKNGARTALNTRFDIYENPHFKNGDKDPNYRPAHNVTKGQVWTGNGGNLCNNSSTSGAMGLPRDKVFSGTNNWFGNGVWDCAAYWAANHTRAAPAGCTSNANGNTGLSRYDVYRDEIANGLPTSSTGTSSEEGGPVCHDDASSLPPFDEANDRRLLNFAVINCDEQNVQGKTTDIAVEAFVRAFITEPTNTAGGSDFRIFLEVVDVVQPGANNGPLKEYVEIFR